MYPFCILYTMTIDTLLAWYEYTYMYITSKFSSYVLVATCNSPPLSEQK